MAAEPEIRWTQDDWGDESDGSKASPVQAFLGQHGWVVRGAIVLLALLLFELTADAALATAVGCLELGRTDFATARWLGRVDPDRARGRLSALCYLIQALNRISTTLFLILVIVMGFLNGLANRGRPIPWPPHILGAVAIWTLASVTAAALSLLACALALVTRRRVWLGPEPRLARRRGVWPPSRVAQPRRAVDRSDVFLQPLLAVWLQISLVMICWSTPPKGQVSLPIVGAVLGMAGGMMALGVLLPRCILARSPTDCWPLDEEVAVGSPGGLQ